MQYDSPYSRNTRFERLKCNICKVSALGDDTITKKRNQVFCTSSVLRRSSKLQLGGHIHTKSYPRLQNASWTCISMRIHQHWKKTKLLIPNGWKTFTKHAINYTPFHKLYCGIFFSMIEPHWSNNKRKLLARVPVKFRFTKNPACKF